MKAIEFKSKIEDNRISIPVQHQSELKIYPDKDVRVIIFIDDSDKDDDKIYRKIATDEFLKGYSDSDSIYDN